MQDYTTGGSDYVIERFSNGEKKQIIKNGYIQYVTCKNSKIGIIWVDNLQWWYYTEADQNGTIDMTWDLN